MFFQSSFIDVLYFIEYLISAIALLRIATNPPGMLLFIRSALLSSTVPSAMPYNDLARLSAATKAVLPLDNSTI